MTSSMFYINFDLCKIYLNATLLKIPRSILIISIHVCIENKITAIILLIKFQGRSYVRLE